jgi:SAM-dependent methyltransferase
MDSKFWDNVYESKSEDGVSWYQEVPKRTLEIILSLNLSNTAKIIDVGGGRSKLSESLYEKSFKDISVLDISGAALVKLKEALECKIPGNTINTITSNIVDAKFSKRFDLWHDRAVFHFLTNADDQKKYVDLLFNSLNDGGYFLISTFSKNGPKKCSGLEICQYDKDDLVSKFSQLELIEFGNEDHHTPFDTVQNFTYCLFRKTVGKT